MKKKVLLSLDEDTIELLNKGSKELGINKSQFVSRLLKDNVENRLSKYIVRDIENLILYFLLNTELKSIDKTDLMEKLDFIYKQTKIIKQSKTILLKEEREKRKKELKSFWNKILKLLEPDNFYKSIGYVNGKLNLNKTKQFLKELNNLIKENKKLWDK